MTRVALTYERLCRIVLMVFVVNVAMLVHTLMGLIVGGFFPSIAAAYATFRTWLIDEDQSWRVRQTWTVFHRAWKDELTQANLFGWGQLIIGLALAVMLSAREFRRTPSLGSAHVSEHDSGPPSVHPAAPCLHGHHWVDVEPVAGSVYGLRRCSSDFCRPGSDLQLWRAAGNERQGATFPGHG